MILWRSCYDVKHAKIKLLKSKKPAPIRLVDDYRPALLSVFGGCVKTDDQWRIFSKNSSKVDRVFLQVGNISQYSNISLHCSEQSKNRWNVKLQNYHLITRWTLAGADWLNKDFANAISLLTILWSRSQIHFNTHFV